MGRIVEIFVLLNAAGGIAALLIGRAGVRKVLRLTKKEKPPVG